MRTKLSDLDWKRWTPGPCPVEPGTRVAMRDKDYRETVTDRPQDLVTWENGGVAWWALAPRDRLGNGRVPRRHEYRAPTTEDWCPTRADGTVKVMVHEGVEVGGIIAATRIAVWGEDDRGMDIEFDIDVVNFEMARIIAENLPRPITFESLDRLGFTWI